MHLKTKKEVRKAARKINSLIESVPQLLQFVLPGAFGLFIFSFFLNYKIENKLYLLLSCCISYCFEAMVTMIFPRITYSAKVSCMYVISMVFALIFVKIFTLKSFQRIISDFTHKTVNSNIWRDVCDLENGTFVKVYLKDKNYYIRGFLLDIDEDNEKWLIVGGYEKYPVSQYVEFGYTKDDSYKYMIRIDDIDHIEMADGE